MVDRRPRPSTAPGEAGGYMPRSPGSMAARPLAGTGSRLSSARTRARGQSGDELFEQPRQAAVGERLAARLAGRAVLQCGVGERHLPDRVTADGARLSRATVHPQTGLL